MSVSKRLGSCVCLDKVHFPSRCKSRAGKLSLQPETLGAGQEATNDLKHFEKRSLKGISGPCGLQRE